MKKVCGILAAVLVILAAGCAAKQLETSGVAVRVTREKPTGDCRELGDVVGSQGNWLTGGYTSNKNLVEGSVNDMRNQAGAMGGNLVWIHQTNTNTGMYSNTVNALTVGTVYQCTSAQQ